MNSDKQAALKELQAIPGIGKSLAEDLWDLGINSVADLKDKSPQKLYDQLCRQTNSHQDPCVLYTFRCAVYFARNKKHDPELLKWWNWKNKELK